MASSVLTALADDVTTLLSVAVATATGTLSREYVPINELQDLAGLLVTVVPRSSARHRLTRTVWERDYQVDVSVQQRAEDDAAVDALTEFAESLSDILETTKPLTVPVDLIASNVVGPHPAHLHESRVCTIVITATYRGGRTGT